MQGQECATQLQFEAWLQQGQECATNVEPQLWPIQMSIAAPSCRHRVHLQQLQIEAWHAQKDAQQTPDKK
jgi:hypothetical protein